MLFVTAVTAMALAPLSAMRTEATKNVAPSSKSMIAGKRNIKKRVKTHSCQPAAASRSSSIKISLYLLNPRIMMRIRLIARSDSTYFRTKTSPFSLPGFAFSYRLCILWRGLSPHSKKMGEV
jgi:hypothetical protein